MKKSSFLLVPVLCIMACVTQPQQKGSDGADTTQLQSSDSQMAYTNAPVTTGCYQYLSQGGDTLSMRITQVNSTEIIGNLDYRFRQKSPNSGTFLGALQGDTLLANYSFLSKGKRSVREVAFLRKGDAWIEGYGPTEGREAVRRFADRSRLQFGDVVFRPAACP